MSATFATEADIQSMMEAVNRAVRAGDAKEADAVLARARAVAPDHPGVLNVAGLRALGAGDPSQARALFERATQQEPNSPLLWVNVALARRELGDAESERDAIEKALAIEPRYFPALLHKARLLERQGKRKAAAVMYHAFLACLPP